MSFFDEDAEPSRRAPRPRRAAPAGGLGVDPQTIWVRRGVAFGAGLLIFVLLVLAVNSCRVSARKNALKDYNREATSLIQQSDGEVGGQLFETLRQGARESPEDLQTQVSSLRVQSETLLQQAEKIDTPGDVAGAQRSLLIALELRRDGLDSIAQRILAATGDEGDAADEAITQIASQMQYFLASDVLLAARVTPLVKKALTDAEVGSQRVVVTRGFLPSYSWLEPSFVADQLGTRLSEGGRNRTRGEPPAPGLHGTGLQSVKVGETTLQPAPAANRIPVADQLTFAVAFQNQGENDEFDVQVVVTLEGPGQPIRARRTVDTVARGATATANLALPKAPTPGEVYDVRVEVRPVPGEKKTDNNRQTYNVLFTQ